MADLVRVVMTFPQTQGYGSRLGNFLYSGCSPKYKAIQHNLFDLITREQWTGCPHDGGQHCFTLYNIERNDAIAWIELWVERYGQWPQTDYILEQLRAGNSHIKLLGARYWQELRDD